MIRIGVLASGSGTNLQALLDACAARRLDAEVALVLSNVPGAAALGRAEAASVPTACLPSKGQADRAAYDAALVERLAAARVDLVCLAGYMRLVTPTFLRAFGPTAATRGCPRVMNVHPALLPSFPGLHAQRQALQAGVKLAGCTVHFVDEGTDTGPIVAQAAVPVLDGDTEEALAARILVQEHRLYPQAVAWFAAGRLSLEGRRVRLDGAPASGALLSPPADA
ncbi:MAG TPA: phosphoribosylglycinamide formyltransferase [Anaeromyxobacteraceae bacterium]|nr:phosphoribosylglycinamide formyltransferase [Anaeromyxobacteraceae bacterium]